MKSQWILAAMLILCVILSPAIVTNHPAIQTIRVVCHGVTTFSFVPVTMLPDSPATVPMYTVTSVRWIHERSPNHSKIKPSTPSEAEAPALAEKALEPYGGLPTAAVLHGVHRSVVQKLNGSSGVMVVEEEYPVYTSVAYTQRINGSPVLGSAAGIGVSLGENNEVVGLSIEWPPTVEYAGEVPIISVEEAFGKLVRRETIVHYQEQSIIPWFIVSEIKLGYYTSTESDRPVYSPVWLFYTGGIGYVPHPYAVDAVRHS
jgi:hypothetical protein